MNYDQCLALLKKHSQQQLLAYYDELDDSGKKSLLNQIASIDFSALQCLEKGGAPIGELAPADALGLDQIEKDRDKFLSAGLQAIREGKVAAVLLAGGQGTRLGSSAPKGTYNIGLTRRLSIFECQMNNLLQVANAAGAYPHLCVMTSIATDAATREFFARSDFFGYPKDRVHFYVQSSAPAISFDGKILLENKGKIAFTPNGNGGWFISLAAAGLVDMLKQSGVEWLNVYGVDNVLQKICDPVFVGATLLSGAACSGKVVTKTSPEEKVGVLCKQDGLPAIVEYFEMPQKEREERDESGRLKYRYGVILNYLFNIQKLEQTCGDKLPYHLSAKKVRCVKDGKIYVPDQPNAYKLETLAVDIVKLMGTCLAFEVERNREFAPVKNATGVDSVDSARELLAFNGIKL